MKNIGINVKLPSNECNDKKCPFHGNTKLRGRTFNGVVIAKDVHKTATVEWGRSIKIPKYERFEKKRTKIRVHNPPCINAQQGDQVKLMECKPLSKTKTFVIIENLGKLFGFEQIKERREESKYIIVEKEDLEKNKEASNIKKAKEDKSDEVN